MKIQQPDVVLSEIPNALALSSYNLVMSELASAPETEAKPKGQQAKSRHVCVERGIYRHLREKTYHERPEINGKRTWRSLGVEFAPQRNLNAARDEYHRRRALEADGKDPYSGQNQKKRAVQASTVGDLIRRYGNDGFLDAHLLERPDKTREDEKRNCNTLLKFWDKIPVEDVEDKVCDDYRDQRVKNVNPTSATGGGFTKFSGGLRVR